MATQPPANLPSHIRWVSRGRQPAIPGMPTQAKPFNLQNTAAPDPHLLAFQDSWKSRLGELRHDEGKMRGDHDARTKQMVSVAQGNIADSAAGAGAALSEDLARRGVSGAGVESGQRGNLSDAAQREQARAATDISLARNNEYEGQRFARENALNNFMMAGFPVAGSIGQRQLDAQQLGLQQYQVMGNEDRQDFARYFADKHNAMRRGNANMRGRAY